MIALFLSFPIQNKIGQLLIEMNYHPQKGIIQRIIPLFPPQNNTSLTSYNQNTLKKT